MKITESLQCCSSFGWKYKERTYLVDWCIERQIRFVVSICPFYCRTIFSWQQYSSAYVYQDMKRISSMCSSKVLSKWKIDIQLKGYSELTYMLYQEIALMWMLPLNFVLFLNRRMKYKIWIYLKLIKRN